MEFSFSFSVKCNISMENRIKYKILVKNHKVHLKENEETTL
jgi:hypothetical protein